jgi:hypothetical protein
MECSYCLRACYESKQDCDMAAWVTTFVCHTSPWCIHHATQIAAASVHCQIIRAIAHTHTHTHLTGTCVHITTQAHINEIIPHTLTHMSCHQHTRSTHVITQLTRRHTLQVLYIPQSAFPSPIRLIPCALIVLIMFITFCSRRVLLLTDILLVPIVLHIVSCSQCSLCIHIILINTPGDCRPRFLPVSP